MLIRIERLRSFVSRLVDVPVLIVGDVMLDEYIWGKVSRISPEAPVPVVEVCSESLRLGGAANVVHNIRALGGRAVLCSVIGNDANGATSQDLLRAIGVSVDTLIADSARPTTLKTRIIAHHQQVVRLDREVRAELSPEIAAQLWDAIGRALPTVEAVIIEDYGKGVVTSDLARRIVALATQNGKIVAVDPKTSHFDRYAGVSVITPNHHEAGAAAQLTIDSHETLLEAGKRLLERLTCEFVLITRGEEGMSLFERETRMVTHVPTMAQEVFDVTGAGDTVVAALTLSFAAGLDPVDAVLLSNAAAGVVVGKVGTATVNPQELSDMLTKLAYQSIDIRQERFA